ncbi:MAG: serine/threonine-protein kinase [Lentisphaeria bacterium]
MKYRCEHCGTIELIREVDLGRQLRCKNCLSRIEVPVDYPGSGFVLGDFYLKNLLGGGSHGEVYLATQLSLDRECALKAFDELMVEEDRFYREVKQTALLNHSGIVQSYFAGFDEGVHYFAMEFMRGGSLSRYLQEHGNIEESVVIKIIGQVVSALKYSWEHFGLLHCDVKCDNILLSEDLLVKLSDFGISDYWDSKERSAEVEIWCSPTYAAPEVIMGDGASIFSDMYSLGVVMYECVSGERLFMGESVEEVCDGHIWGCTRNKVERLNVSNKMKGIIGKLLEKSSDKRYKTYDDLLEDLNKVSGFSWGYLFVILEFLLIMLMIINLCNY